MQLHHRRRQLLRLIGDDAEAVDVVNAMLGGVEVADFRLENERAELRRQFSRNGDFTWGGSGVSSIWTTCSVWQTATTTTTITTTTTRVIPYLEKHRDEVVGKIGIASLPRPIWLDRKRKTGLRKTSLWRRKMRRKRRNSV